MTATTPTDVFHSPLRYGDMEGWRDEIMRLHEAGPIHRIEAPGFRPFWGVIGHPEVMDIERQSHLFKTEPEAILISDEMLRQRDESGINIRTIVHMDDPDHGKYRRLTSDWFKPANIGRLRARCDELSRAALDTMRVSGGQLDFNRDVAMVYPLQVILAILGLPESDYPRMLKLTQEMFGSTDPDLARDAPTGDEATLALMDFYQYFTELTVARRTHPTDDLATLIANGEIDGEPLPDLESMSYYVIIASAGHDTTSASMAEGMRRLAENPAQLRLLQERPELIANGVEEMIRVSSAVKHFMREAADDTEIAGVPISKGDWLMVNFAAANLDPRVFDDPVQFDVERENADKQIAFGFGMHFCLGAQLARLEMRSLFEHLVPEIDELEIAGTPTTVQGVFVSGHKQLPIRYRLR
ncbi:MAG: cytochrome P450 [Actinomycetota bacterium]